jgi:hypothetical protein
MSKTNPPIKTKSVLDFVKNGLVTRLSTTTPVMMTSLNDCKETYEDDGVTYSRCTFCGRDKLKRFNMHK